MDPRVPVSVHEASAPWNQLLVRLSTCIICLEHYNPATNAGHSLYTCDQHEQCACGESVFDPEFGPYCARCSYATECEVMRQVELNRPRVMTPEAWAAYSKQKRDADLFVALAKGRLESYNERIAARLRTRRRAGQRRAA